MRVVPGLDGREVIARLRDLLGDEVGLERRLDPPAVATDPGSLFEIARRWCRL